MDKPGDQPTSADETLEGQAAGAPPLGRVLRGAVTEGPGSRVGRYKLIQKLGEGGFGVVFQAEQDRPVRRMVAVKIIRLGKAKQSTISGPGIITAQIFEAMANFKAGREKIAMDQWAACVHRMDAELPKAGQRDLAGFDNWLICQIARREAEAIIH